MNHRFVGEAPEGFTCSCGRTNAAGVVVTSTAMMEMRCDNCGDTITIVGPDREEDE